VIRGNMPTQAATRIALLTGGASTERDVALASAAQVLAALRSRGHRVNVVDIAAGTVAVTEEHLLLKAGVGTRPPAIESLDAREREFLLARLGAAVQEAEVLFLALHGGRGEDGTLQAVLDVIGLPYTGSGALASGLAMDKDLSKRIFQLAGILTPDWGMAPVSVTEAGDRFGWPLIVKPSKQGSTVGLSLVKNPESYADAIREAEQFDDEVMVEAYLPGRELTVGVLDGEALTVGEIVPEHEIFDYECKYQPGMAREIFPADIDPDVTAECCRLAVAAHIALKLGGYSRVDFRLTAEGYPSCLEVNTLPGLTAASLLPKSARASGIEFDELCEQIGSVARRTS